MQLLLMNQEKLDGLTNLSKLEDAGECIATLTSMFVKALVVISKHY